MGSPDQITIIIPCYWLDQSFIDMTNVCLTSLKGSPIDELIVVDDGSPLSEMSFETIVKSNIYLTRKVNKGYASAVNTGLRSAIGDILIICNNDIEFVDPHWLHHLTQPLEDGYDICSIRTTDSDGWETRDELEEGAKFGSIWAMKRKVYETIGGLDTSFGKGYFEDLDYQKRAEDAGFRVVKNHNGLVEHRGKATFSQVDPQDTAFIEARKKFIKKWGRVW